MLCANSDKVISVIKISPLHQHGIFYFVIMLYMHHVEKQIWTIYTIPSLDYFNHFQEKHPINKRSTDLSLSSPKLSSISVATPQLLPSLMRLFNDLTSLLCIEPFLIESKSIQRLIIWCLVPPEPFTNAILDSGWYIINIIVFLC